MFITHKFHEFQQINSWKLVKLVFNLLCQFKNQFKTVQSAYL